MLPASATIRKSENSDKPFHKYTKICSLCRVCFESSCWISPSFWQILACMTKNLLLFDLGLSYGFPTIVIPVLLGFAKDTNPNETIHFTASQASWYGEYEIA